MKISKSFIKQFEQDQKQFGTRTALFNVVYLIAAELLNDIGIKKITTSMKVKVPKK